MREATYRVTGPGRFQQLVEVGVFLFIIIPSMAVSFVAGQLESLDFTVVALSNMLRDLALLSLVLYFVWSNGEGFGALGWRWGNAAREMAVGFVLFIPFIVFAVLLSTGLHGAGLSGPEHPPAFLIPASGPQYLLSLVFLFVVAVSEETIFRGYLLLRFGALTRSPAAAVLISSAIFSLGHGYQGTAGVFGVGVLGIIFALVYLWRGSLIAPMVIHFLQDFVGTVVVPLLTHH